MTFENPERAKFLAVHSIGPKMLSLIERSGFSTLQEFASLDPGDLAFQIQIETGVKLNGNGLKALQNLIAAADLEKAGFEIGLS